MNKNILILGGSSGIGLSSAKYLVSQGYDVFIASRTNPNINIKHIFVDITKEQSIKELFEYFDKNKILIYAIIYSIGITKKQENIKNFNLQEFNNIISTNLTGAILSLKYGYKFLKATKGRVIIINSIASQISSKFSSLDYTVSKSALSGMVKQLSQEWAKDNILINSIYPSMTHTDMLDNVLNKEVINNISNDIPLKRLANTKEIAKTIAFLLDKDISYITGTGININGGLYLNG